MIDATDTELARLRHQLHALQSINEVLRSGSDLRALYGVVGEQLRRALPFDSLLIGVYDREAGVLQYEYGLDDGIVDHGIYRRALDDAPLGSRVIRGGRVISIPDLLCDPVSSQLRTFGDNDRPSRAWLGAPMIIGGAAQGMVAVMSYAPAVFSAAEADMLLLMASQLAVAVQNARLVAQLQTTIVQLSAPILPVADGVLALPLIGHVDATRMSRIAEHALEAVSDRGAHTLLLDVTGVDRVDQVAVDRLISIVKTVGLIGARCGVVGVSPALAQAAVALGLDLRTLHTFRDLQTALGVWAR